ncbi:Interferon- developmental regulator 1 [Coemansia sp. RSA 988]|nr:Interferon- developmental regulator 1 [Coemansia sp. RSA 988]
MAPNNKGNNELLRTALSSKSARISAARSKRETPSSQSQRSSRTGSGVASCDETENEGEGSDDGLTQSEAEEVGAEVSTNWEDQLEEALEGVGEKRVTTREKSLTTVERLMSHVYMGESLKGRRVTLLEALRRGARSTKSDKERVLALRCIALWFVSFGAETEGAQELPATAELLRVLVADDVDVTSEVRAAALWTLGMANFISTRDYRDAGELLQIVWDLLEATLTVRDAVLARQGFETAGLLLTEIFDSNVTLGEQLFDKAFATHIRALTADAVEVRIAAAQNIALVHDALSAERNTTERPIFGERHDELVGILEMLQHEPAKRHSRKATVPQRVVMREVLETIEHTQTPKIRLSMHGRVIWFDDWTRILRLQAFRKALGGGLPQHFLHNPLLQEVFEVDFDVNSEDYLINAARVVVSPSSDLAKARTVELRKCRDARRTAQSFDDEE